VAVGAALMLLANPLEITNAGFWLTFGATGALLAAGSRWQPPREPRWWHAPLAIVAGTVAVELVLTPVSAYAFQRVTLAGLVLNLAAIPAMALVQGAGTACVLLDLAGLEAGAALAGWTTHAGAWALLESARLVELAPWAAWRVPSPPLGLIAVHYAVLAGGWAASAPPVDAAWRRLAARVCALSALAIWGWIATAPQVHARAALDTRLRLTVMDVGQGEALLATFPNGRTLLVDAGGVSTRGAFDVGERILGPALRRRGLGALDYLAITHGDPDHIGGAEALVRDFRPREVWAGVPVARHAPQEALREAARSARSTWRWLRRGDRMEVGGVDVEVHHPPPPEWERQQVRNDDSLVSALHYGDVSLLLTGDISHAVEHDLASLLQMRRIVVLKAPHHGSATSSSARLVWSLSPAAVLISAGRGNLYGHPTPVVLGRYADAGAEIFRTDRDGQIELATDGQTVQITTFTGRRWRRR
jgi:competence protein ComEC